MNNNDKDNFEKLVRATATMYPNIKPENISTMMLKLFFSSLSKFTFEQVAYGFEAHISDSVDGKFFPKPANIIKHLEAEQLSPKEKAELSWAQIERSIRTTGSWGKLELDDKQGLAALKSFTTWKSLCEMESSKLTWAKKEFMSMYSTYEKTPVEMLPSSLPGRVELVEHKERGAQDMKNILEGINRNRLENK